MRKYITFLFIISLSSMLLIACVDQTSPVSEQDQTVHQEKGEDNAEEMVDLFERVVFAVKEDQTEVGRFEIDLREMETVYTFDQEVKVVFQEFYPDFIFTNNEPGSKSDYPINPAFTFIISKGDREETHLVAIGQSMSSEDVSRFEVEIVDYSLQAYDLR